MLPARGVRAYVAEIVAGGDWLHPFMHSRPLHLTSPFRPDIAFEFAPHGRCAYGCKYMLAPEVRGLPVHMPLLRSHASAAAPGEHARAAVLAWHAVLLLSISCLYRSSGSKHNMTVLWGPSVRILSTVPPGWGDACPPTLSSQHA